MERPKIKDSILYEIIKISDQKYVGKLGKLPDGYCIWVGAKERSRMTEDDLTQWADKYQVTWRLQK